MKKHICWIIILSVYVLPSCSKFLSENGNYSTVIPSKLEDLQALLDANSKINSGNYPGLLEMGTDDFTIDYTILEGLVEFERSAYLWDPEDYYTTTYLGWNWTNCYEPILICNTVLEFLPKINQGNGQKTQEIKGMALFLRAFSYFHLAQVYARPYGDTDHPEGVLYRPASDLSVPTVRLSVHQTYDMILADLREAIPLLPEGVDMQVRPSRAAAWAFLARVSLYLGRYEDAFECADEALKYGDGLLDLNDPQEVNVSSNAPFQPFNKEMMFFAYSNSLPILNPSRCNISAELYGMYAEEDLRRKAFFAQNANGSFSFKGSYIGESSVFFVGLTTSEVLLIRAEASCRLGQIKQGKDDLNKLLEHRIAEESFLPFKTEDADVLLKKILDERRKELPFRGLRWSDLRRYGREGKFVKEVQRIVDGGIYQGVYTLKGNDVDFVYPIPKEVIDIQSGILKN